MTVAARAGRGRAANLPAAVEHRCLQFTGVPSSEVVLRTREVTSGAPQNYEHGLCWSLEKGGFEFSAVLSVEKMEGTISGREINDCML